MDRTDALREIRQTSIEKKIINIILVDWYHAWDKKFKWITIDILSGQLYYTILIAKYIETN